MLKEKWVNVHVVNDLATKYHTGLVYSIFTILLTSNSDLTINQPKSPIIFLYFRHEPINKFNGNASVTTATCESTSNKSPKKDRFSSD